MKRALGALAIFGLLGLVACKKTEPDNAMTRYADNLARDERRAEDVADRANAAVAQEQKVMNQAGDQSTDSSR